MWHRRIARRRPILDSLVLWTLLIPVAVGALYSVLCVPVAIAFCRPGVTPFCRRPRGPAGARPAAWPAVTILKPVCGPERDLRANLESACRQDYPEYQVVISAQDPGDPALMVARQIQEQFGAKRV